MTAERERTVADRAAGIAWYNSLDYAARWGLADGMVLGAVDWRDFGFDEKPSAAFRAGVVAASDYWEEVREDLQP